MTPPAQSESVRRAAAERQRALDRHDEAWERMHQARGRPEYPELRSDVLVAWADVKRTLAALRRAEHRERLGRRMREIT